MSIIVSQQLAAFSKWLNNQGADVMKPTNEFEVVRFSCKHGVGVVYRGKRGLSVSSPMVSDAIECFKASKSWDGKGSRTKNAGKKKPQLILRDGHGCFYCGREFDKSELTLEHLLSRAHGGPDKLFNMVLACEPCNIEADCLPLPEKVLFRDRKRLEGVL